MSDNQFEDVSITITSPKDIVLYPIEKVDWDELYSNIENKSKMKSIIQSIISILGPTLLGYGLSLLLESSSLWALVWIVVGVITLAITKSMEIIKFSYIRVKASYIQNKISQANKNNK